MMDDTMDMDDGQLNALLRGAAGGYNQPPARVPVDEMWTHIQAAQRRTTRVTVRPWWGMAAAAVLLLGTGVGVGHYGWRTSGAPEVQRVATSAATTPPASTVTATDSVAADAGGNTVAPLPADLTPLSSTGNAASERRTHPTPSVIAPRGASTSLPATPSTTPTFAAQPETYQLATLRHFTAVEALLTSFRSPSDKRTDAQLAAWARDLLSNTRLLLDSPAADDPTRRKLLEDLELVLAEMVQLSPGATASDRDLINGSVRRGDVLTRLRTAIPAGNATQL